MSISARLVALPLAQEMKYCRITIWPSALIPTNAAILHNRGLAKLKKGDLTAGNADIARAKQLDPSR